jgi:site-specific DNA-methyltransferase (adenine-specific)
MNIQIENKDCLELLKTLEDNSVGHINVDPPYNIGYDGGEGWDTFESEEAYLDWCKQWSSELARVLMPGRIMCIWGTQKNDLFFRLKLEVLNKLEGMKSQSAIHWSYNWGGRTKLNFAHKFETAWVYSKGNEFLFNDDDIRVEREVKINMRTKLPYDKGTIPTTVWQHNLHTTTEEAKESRFHPTVKPQFVIQRMIKAYSNPGDLVLDIFSGSGTTAVACEITGRDFIGCENHEEYYLKSLERLSKHKLTF